MEPMPFKKCTRCLSVKSIDQFRIRSDRKDGRESRCKACLSEIYLSQKDLVLERNRIYRETNKERFLELQRGYWHKHRDARLLSQREYQRENKEKLRQQQLAYREKNKELISRRNREQYLKSKPLRKEYARQYNAAKRASDPIFRLKESLRTRTSSAIRRKGYTKKSGLAQVLGCSWDYLKGHLEKQFTEGMTWDNYGRYWVIDHYIPLAGASSEAELIGLCHYTNLKPLEKIENLRKGRNSPE